MLGRSIGMFLWMAAAWLPCAARANDSAMGGHGGNLVPLQETRVVMVSEDIELRYEDDDWHVRAHYVFRNETDEPVSLQMGFPETHCEGEGDCVMGEGDVFRDMRTLVRGKPVPRKKGALSKKHAWAPELGMVWLYDVRFEPREELVIDHSYTTPSGIDVTGTHSTAYVTRTGALWGKPIERATFVVRLPASTRQLHEAPAPRRIEAARLEGGRGPLVLTYEARNWTPETDFFIGFRDRVDWYDLPEPAGPLANLRCEGLFSLYLVTEADDGRSEEALDELPSDLPSLRICRNAVYAQYGRRFRDEALNQYFYGPKGFVASGPALLAFDPNPAYRDSLLSAQDHAVLAMILTREQSLRPAAVPVENAAEAPPGDPTPGAKTGPELQVAAALPATGKSASEPSGCGGCHAKGGGASMAWALIGLLALRSRHLRRRGAAPR